MTTPLPGQTNGPNVAPPSSSKVDGSPMPHEDNNKTGVPSPDECIVHLKLLAAFARLNQTISFSDGLFGIHANQLDGLHKPVYTDRDAALAIFREKRWEIYVTRAVDRFETWLQSCVPSDGWGSNPGGAVTVADVEHGAYYPYTAEWRGQIPWSADTMPPLGAFVFFRPFTRW